MSPARILVGAASALAILALPGCSFPWGCTDTWAERGEATASVRIVDTSGQALGVTAEVVGWRLEPHPQTPTEGDRVHFTYRFDGVAGTDGGPAVDACAVDGRRVALMCLTVHASGAWPEPDGSRTGDDWLHVEHPDRVAGVLLIPDDQSYQGRTCAQDVKDGGGTHPPEPARRGDQL
ncbi:hypothetical protein [Streptomyces avicenniae]|uniref:hypothetical protein n=1 Tax=Streptomyces avicenniae TaxID=500153 RepID=UPI000A952EDE|nr:hypothetical protein [Streptomyces avicenniae]